MKCVAILGILLIQVIIWIPEQCVGDSALNKMKSSAKLDDVVRDAVDVIATDYAPMLAQKKRTSLKRISSEDATKRSMVKKTVQIMRDQMDKNLRLLSDEIERKTKAKKKASTRYRKKMPFESDESNFKVKGKKRSVSYESDEVSPYKGKKKNNFKLFGSNEMKRKSKGKKKLKFYESDEDENTALSGSGKSNNFDEEDEHDIGGAASDYGEDEGVTQEKKVKLIVFFDNNKDLIHGGGRRRRLKGPSKRKFSIYDGVGENIAFRSDSDSPGRYRRGRRMKYFDEDDVETYRQGKKSLGAAYEHNNAFKYGKKLRAFDNNETARYKKAEDEESDTDDDEDSVNDEDSNEDEDSDVALDDHGATAADNDEDFQRPSVAKKRVKFYDGGENFQKSRGVTEKNKLVKYFDSDELVAVSPKAEKKSNIFFESEEDE